MSVVYLGMLAVRRPVILPRLGPRPQGMLPVYGALLLCAWLLLLPASATPWKHIPGDLQSPEFGQMVNIHWLVHSQGLLDASQSHMLGYPVEADRLATGLHLNTLASWPLVKALGWPTGFTLFIILILWAAGVSMAWLACQWWRSPGAALLSGVAYQASGVLSLELYKGCDNNVFGAIFVPLALGLMARALVTARLRDALLAGVMTGLAALSYWYLGLFLALGLAILILYAFLERRLNWLALFLTLVGLLLVAGIPLIRSLDALAAVPGVGVGKWGVVAFGRYSGILVQWIVEKNSLFSADISTALLSIRPFLLALIVLGLMTRTSRRWAAPLAWILLATLLAMGPWVQLSGGLYLATPQMSLMDNTVIQRLWWPYRAMLLAAPALALLAGGGVARLESTLRSLPGTSGSLWSRRKQADKDPNARRWAHKLRPLVAPVLSVMILAEAFVALPQLPLPAVAGEPSEAALALAKDEGPALVLPLGGGPLRKGKPMLLDQIHHQRPLLNTLFFPHQTMATEAFRKSPAWLALEYFGRCELNAEIPYLEMPSKGLAGLKQAGLKTVYVEERALGKKKRRLDYLICVEQMLGKHQKRVPPYLVYAINR